MSEERQNPTAPVGFIGLGIMGGGMVSNLVRKGFPVLGWNRTPARSAPLAELGMKKASSAAEVAARTENIFICVSDTPDVAEVIEGPEGILAQLKPGQLVVDHSTISPQETRRLAGLCQERRANWLDAPVSGGSEGAQRGTLSIMVGGAADNLERVRPWLQAYGTTITHVGETGTGQLAKLVNQIMVVLNQLAASEGLLLAKAGGLDLERTLTAVRDGAGGSWMLSNRGPQMIDGDWRPGFTIDLQQKDLRLVLEAADQIGVPLPGVALVFQLYRSLQSQGLGGEGNHALIKALENLWGKP